MSSTQVVAPATARVASPDDDQASSTGQHPGAEGDAKTMRHLSVVGEMMGIVAPDVDTAAPILGRGRGRAPRAGAFGRGVCSAS